MKKENWFKKVWQLIVGGFVLISGVAALSVITILVGAGFVAWWFIARAVKKKKQAEVPVSGLSPATAPTPAEVMKTHLPPVMDDYEAPNVKTYKVAGMSHYMDAILSLADENDDYSLSKRELVENDLVDQRIWQYEFYPIKTELVPEPDNPHDPNAIKVMVDGVQVGHIKRGSCAHLLKVINEGRLGRIGCMIGGGPYKYVYEDYKDDDWSADPKAVYTLEKDKVEYFVHLRIEEL